MALVLTNGRISVGAYKFPDTKKIAICVKEGNKITVAISIRLQMQSISCGNWVNVWE